MPILENGHEWAYLTENKGIFCRINDNDKKCRTGLSHLYRLLLLAHGAEKEKMPINAAKTIIYSVIHLRFLMAWCMQCEIRTSGSTNTDGF